MKNSTKNKTMDRNHVTMATSENQVAKRAKKDKNAKKKVQKSRWTDRKLNLKPVVILEKKDLTSILGVGPTTKRNDSQDLQTERDLNMQPVVLVEKLRDDVSSCLTNSRSKTTAVTENCRYPPVVSVVECMEELHRRSVLASSEVCTDSWSRKRESLDIKVSQLEMKPCITIPVITQLLVDAVTLGNAPSRHNRPFDLTNPNDECDAIVEAISIYAACVPPEESVCLFYSGGHRQNSFSLEDAGIENFYDWNNQEMEGKRNGWNFQPWNPAPLPWRQNVKKREGKRKGWTFIATLGSSDFFFRMKLTPRGRETFERKMLAIMKAALGVDPYNWTMSEVGYILGFWLAKLYNARGIPDENLPKELVLTKEHFLELHGLTYNDAIVITRE